MRLPTPHGICFSQTPFPPPRPHDLQAVKLLVKGVPFYPPPSKAYQREMVAEGGQAAVPEAAAPTGENGALKGDAVEGSDGRCPVGPSANGRALGGGLCPVAAVAAGGTASAWGSGAAQHSHPRNGVTGTHFVWRPAPRWPWREA